MRFNYYNDTGRIIGIHPATVAHGVGYEGESEIIHGEIKEFELPEGSVPTIKMWDYGGKHGLQILVSVMF